MELKCFWWDEKGKRAVSADLNLGERFGVWLLPEAFTPVCQQTLQLASLVSAGTWPAIAAVADGEAAVREWVRQQQITVPVHSDRGGKLFRQRFSLDTFKYERSAVLFDGSQRELISESEHAIEQVYHMWAAVKKEG